ncbi:MAG: hypothetical protein IM559_21135 [Pseudanabaena sp. M151S2SP2A07QC]|nr:hypothetical protein [Pseudanabaena sp. M151S2SP2A07QC]
MKQYDIGKLNNLYKDAETADQKIFDEMKTNVLLISGNHYKRFSKGYEERVKSPLANDENRIKFTKNHTRRIARKYVNGIMSLVPDLKVMPANPSELQDKKAAELYDSVLQYGKNRYRLLDKKEEWCEDFVDMGEAGVKVYFDPSKGEVVGYEQKIESEFPVFLDASGKETIIPQDQMGNQHSPAPDKAKPIMSGDFCFETVLGFNLMRDPQAETMDESPYLILRKMMSLDDAKKLVSEDDQDKEEKLRAITASSESTYKVFDTNHLSHSEAKGKVLIREYYFRPCYDFPEGYYYITADGNSILHEGPLPFGIWPIAHKGFDRIQTSPRSSSIIRAFRPFQVEINRASSKQIENSIVHGDTKVITSPGTKLSQGAVVGGVRQFQAVGVPTIIPGQNGDQYTPYIQQMTQEGYQVVEEESEDGEIPAQLDAQSLLFRSIKRKARYGKYAKAYQSFLSDVYWIYLKLAKQYFDENRFIKAVGRSEAINLAEFKSANELSVEIKLDNSTEDADSMLAKSAHFERVLQYVGKDLPPGALGKLLTNMPFINGDQVFKGLTQDYKNIENDMLALDRGEQIPATPDDKHELYIQELTARIKSPDFRLLSPQVQQNYLNKREEHRQMLAEQEQQLLMAQQQAIPMTGNLVKVDVYEMVNGKQVRMTLPADAVNWLKSKLDQQGMTQQRLEGLAMGDQASIAMQIVNEMQNQQQQVPQEQGVMNGPNGIG